MGGKRPRQVKHNVKKKVGFMSLPPEIRNRVYQYYFDSNNFRCEITSKQSPIDRPEAQPLFKWRKGFVKQEVHDPIPTTKLRVSRRLGSLHQIVQRESTKWSTSLCPLILACKQIYTETVPFLYQNTSFVFNAPKRMSRFFGIVSMQNLSHIRKLELYYIPYQHPALIAQKDLVKAHNIAWIRECKAAAQKLVNLESLTIHIYGSYGKRFFDLRQDIVKPFMQFRLGPDIYITYPPKVKHVKVTFNTWWSRTGCFGDNVPLTEASKELHKVYAETIEKFILGESEGDAMEGFKDAWIRKHSYWNHHLSFYHTSY